MGKKYDYFDEQSDQVKQDERQIARQVEQMARDQARESLKRSREASQRMAEVADKEAFGNAAGVGTGTAAGTTGAGTTGAAASGNTAAAGGGSAVNGAVGAGTGAAGGGAAAFWKVILIIVIVIAVIVALYFLISAIVKLAQNLRDVEENPVEIAGIDPADRTVNNAEYVLKLIEEGYISLETSQAGAFDDDYAKQVLEAVVEERESRGERINVSYEGVPWVLVEDADGNTLADLRQEYIDEGETPPDYYEDSSGETYTNEMGTWQETTLDPIQLHTVLSRRDIETTSFTADYFEDPYELRWQPVYVLCAMRISGIVPSWGLSETDEEGNPLELTVDIMSDSGVGDYFLKEEDIEDCINCFKPNFRYIWNPLDENLDGAEFTFDDSRMVAYLEDDQRELPNTSLGGRAYVFHIPSVAASSVDLGYRRVEFNIERIDENTHQITSRTIYETPEEWMEKLNEAAGGYFSKDRFLYLLGQLPGTEDMVEEYRAIFEAEDSQRIDYTIDGCVGAYIRSASVISPFIPGGDGTTTGLNFEYAPVGESVILEMRNCYINQGDPRWGSATRGDGTYTIGSAGCIDCCFAMCSHYFNGGCAPMQIVSTQYIVGGQSFHFGNFCTDYHLGWRIDGTRPFPVDAVKRHLQNGNLVIMQIEGPWVSETGRVLHRSVHTHYIVIYGYDARGFYLCDPGNAGNSTATPLSYNDIMNAPLKNNTFITSQNPGFIPKFAVNTLTGGWF